MDGHESYVQLDVTKTAMEGKMDIALIPPHSSHVVRPLDRGPYAIFKGASNAAFAETAGCQLILLEHVHAITSCFSRVCLHPWHGMDAIDPAQLAALRASNSKANALLGRDMAEFVEQLNELAWLMSENAAMLEHHAGFVGINCVRPSQTVQGEFRLQAVKNRRNYERKDNLAIIMTTDDWLEMMAKEDAARDAKDTA